MTLMWTCETTFNQSRRMKMKKYLILLMVLSMAFFSGSVWAQKTGGGKAFKQGQKAKVEQHKMQQKTENKEFRTTLKGMEPEVKKAAATQHREIQYNENKNFRDKMQQEKKEFVTQKLANNPKLTEDQKNAIASQMDVQHQENQAYRDQQHQQNMIEIQKIMTDKNMPSEQKRAALQASLAKQRSENKDYRNTQKTENQEFKNQMKASAQSNSPSQT